MRHYESGTNYQLSRAMWSTLNNKNYDELQTALLREDALYSELTLVNFLGNHDVPRIASTLHHPEHYLHVCATMCLLPGGAAAQARTWLESTTTRFHQKFDTEKDIAVLST